MSRIFKRGNTWYVDFEYQGKRIRKSLGIRSKQMAELRLKDIDVKIAQKKFNLGPPDSISFQDFAKKFLEWYEVQNSMKSYEDYRNLFRSTLIPYFSNLNLTDINTEMIEIYKAERIKKISPSSVNKELIALRHLFNKAILWGYLALNPAKDVKKLRVRQKTVRFLSVEEIHMLLAVNPSHLRPVFMTAIHTGLRKSELFRLEWDDIDFNRGNILVRNKEEGHTKNYKIREVPMTVELKNELKQMKDKNGKESGFVFLRIDGLPHGGDIRRTLVRCIKKTGMRPFTLHDLRHTFASHLVMDGVDLASVKELMGHSEIKTTMIYAHLAPDHLSNAIEKLGKRFNLKNSE